MIDRLATRHHWLIYSAPILLLAVVSLLMRPPLPIDETRYLAVAWEMHLNGDWLVPHLNGRPYSQKPPLLFWLINAGWQVFGVNQWWPRLLPALAAIITLGLVQRISQRLGRSSPAPLLVGCLAWPLYSSVLLFDMLMAMFAALGWLGILRAGSQQRGGLTLIALALGLGILCKGPVIFLYVLPFALLTPTAPPFGKWLLQLLLATLAAAAIALAWALPAASLGGQSYGDDLLWGQTAGRMRNSFSHQSPWWWYFPILMALFLPWAWLPNFWRQLGRAWKEQQSRWLLLAFLIPFALFCLMSGKQPHYLLPLMPLVFVAIAGNQAKQSLSKSAFAIPVILSLTLIFLPSAQLDPFRVETLAAKIHQLQQQNIPVLHAGKYHGDFHYLGRLEQRIHVRKDVRKIPAWVAEYKRGYLLTTDRHAERSDYVTAAMLENAEYVQPYRSGKIYLLPVAHEPAPPSAATTRQRAEH